MSDSSAIWEDLNTRLKTAMKAGKTKERDVIRMVKSRIQAETKSADFTGDLDDALCVRLIKAYVVQMQKAIPDYEKAGERAADDIAQLRFEIEYLTPFLPAKLDEEATRTLVSDLIGKLGVSGGKHVGRVMGTVMKDHKDSVDAGLVRRIAAEILGD